MTNEANCMSISAAKERLGSKRPTNSDLQREIRALRQRLKFSENAASRHAVMLREGDHRIKNSLQLVASLVRLQATREASTPVRDALRSAAARVSCVAGIHDALQGAIGLDLVDLGASLRRMCASLQSMAGDDGHIEVIVDSDALEIPVVLAQPLLLAVNELILNALRHAFPHKPEGSVRVSLSRTSGNLSICVADDGVGLPANHANAQGYGMTLVSMMVKQVDGRLLTENKAGARFTIDAPLAD